MTPLLKSLPCLVIYVLIVGTIVKVVNVGTMSDIMEGPKMIELMKELNRNLRVIANGIGYVLIVLVLIFITMLIT